MDTVRGKTDTRPRFFSLSRASPDAVEAALAKILASEHLAHSGQLSRFLEFTVTLAGKRGKARTMLEELMRISVN